MDFLKTHPKEEWIDSYRIDVLGVDKYQVHRPNRYDEWDLANAHIVSACKYQICPRQDGCRVLCDKCGSAICKHIYTCKTYIQFNSEFDKLFHTIWLLVFF